MPREGMLLQMRATASSRSASRRNHWRETGAVRSSSPLLPVASAAAAIPSPVANQRRCGRSPRTARRCGRQSAKAAPAKPCQPLAQAGDRLASEERELGDGRKRRRAEVQQRVLEAGWQPVRPRLLVRRDRVGEARRGAPASIASALGPTRLSTARGSARPAWPRAMNRQSVCRETPNALAVRARPCRSM